MKTGINLLLWTTCVEKQHLPLLAEIKAAGYSGAEIPIHGTDPSHYRWLGEQLDALGLERTASTALPGPEANLIGSDAASRQAGIDYLKGIIDSTHALGSKILIGPMYQALCAFTGAGPTEQEFSWAEEGLRAVAPHAEAAGVVLCLEPLNRFECHLLNTIEAGATFVQRINHPNIRIMYDTFHANIEEADPFQPIDDFGEWIAHVHISENHRGAPGSGHAPLKETIRRFLAAGYTGPFVVEAFGTSLPELAEATRCWRPTFHSETDVLEAGIRLFREVANKS